MAATALPFQGACRIPGARHLTEIVHGVPVVRAPAEIDTGAAGSLLDALLAPLARGHATVVADLTRTWFCDPAGLQALESAHREALAEGGGLRVVVRATDVRRTFSVAGIRPAIPLFTSLDKALAQPPAISIWPGRTGRIAEFPVAGVAAPT